MINRLCPPIRAISSLHRCLFPPSFSINPIISFTRDTDFAMSFQTLTVWFGFYRFVFTSLAIGDLEKYITHKRPDCYITILIPICNVPMAQMLAHCEDKDWVMPIANDAASWSSAGKRAISYFADERWKERFVTAAVEKVKIARPAALVKLAEELARALGQCVEEEQCSSPQGPAPEEMVHSRNSTETM
jgi:hypothetical protein